MIRRSERIDRYFGEIEGCYLSYASDADLREGAASGGTVTAVLLHLLDANEIQGALVCRNTCGEQGIGYEFFIARNQKDLLSAQTSKYFEVRFLRDALPKLKAFEGRVAVVTLPCDATLLRRQMEKDESLREKISLIITLFCGHASKKELLSEVLRRRGIRESEVEDFRFRVGQWRGQMRLRLRSGKTVEFPFGAYSLYQNLFFFCPRKCLFCGDHFGCAGNLNVGDIWSLEMKRNPIKHSSLIARTKRGLEAVESARSSGMLETRQVPLSTIFAGQKRSLPFHYNLAARAKAARRVGWRIEDETGERVRWNDLLAAKIALANYLWSRSPRWRKWIFRLPRPLLTGYLYLFKALQSLPSGNGQRIGRIGIIGGTLSGNKGAEAMLTTAACKLRQLLPDREFALFSYYPKRDRKIGIQHWARITNASPISLVTRFLPGALLVRLAGVFGLRVPGKLLPKPVRVLRDCEVLVDVGGITFSDGREIYLPFNVLCIWPAMLMGVPVVKFAQAMGPFKHRLNRWLARWLLPRCAHIFARAEETFQFLRGIGISRNVSLSPDVAFAFDDECRLRTEEEGLAEEPAKEGRQVGICPSSVVYQECLKRGIDYPGVLAEFIGRLLEKGWRVVLVPNAIREQKDRLKNNDVPIIEMVSAGLEERAGLEVFARDVDAMTIKRIIARCDFFISSRFHALIGALTQGVPTLVCGWGHKYFEVLDRFNLWEHAFDYRQLTLEILEERFARLVEEDEEIRGKIARHLPEVQAEAMTQVNFVRGLLE
jgi:coenzyme F420-reducing hydrogenase beta subunit/polysaccharide pyruvyl transferase WcaK-like protein